MDAKAEDVGDFDATMQYKLYDVQIIKLAQYLPLEDIVVCAGANDRFCTFTERQVYNRYVSPFSTSQFAVCLECGWGYNEACEYYTGYDEPARYILTAAAPPSNNRLAKKFLCGLANYQLELAQKRVDAYLFAKNPLPMTSIKILLGYAYSSIATSSASIGWASLLENVFEIAKHSLQSLCVCHVIQRRNPAATVEHVVWPLRRRRLFLEPRSFESTRERNSFVLSQLRTMDKALSQPGAYPSLTHLTVSNEFLDHISEQTVCRLSETVQHLDVSSCTVQTCFAEKPLSYYADPNGLNNQQLNQHYVFPRVHTLRLNSLTLNKEFEVCFMRDMRNVYRSLPNVCNILARYCECPHLYAELNDGASDGDGHMPWFAGEKDYNFKHCRRRQQIAATCHSFKHSLQLRTNLEVVNDADFDSDDEQPKQQPMPAKVLRTGRQIKIVDNLTTRFSPLADVKFIANRENYAKYFVPVHGLHCSQHHEIGPLLPPPPSMFEHERILWPRIAYEIQLSNVGYVQGMVSRSDVYWAVHKQVSDWLASCDLMRYCNHKFWQRQRRRKCSNTSLSTVCAVDQVPTCTLQISQLWFNLTSIKQVEIVTTPYFFLNYKFKAILHALAGLMPLFKPGSDDYDVKLAKSVEVLPTPLLQVRRIVLQCSVKVSSDLFYGRQDADVADPSKLLAKIISTFDSKADAPPIATSPSDDAVRFELLSQKFRNDLKPLVGLITERFVRLRYLSVVCVCNDQAIVYNFDDVVLAKRAEQSTE